MSPVFVIGHRNPDTDSLLRDLLCRPQAQADRRRIYRLPRDL
ncbi:MAG: hypothetical protein ACLS69_00615 [Butyricicoccus sp.]